MRKMSYRLLILWRGLGEYEWAKRIENLAQTHGWPVMLALAHEQPDSYEQIITRDVVSTDSLLAQIDKFKPDIVINMTGGMLVPKVGINYLVLSGACEQWYMPYDIFAYNAILSVSNQNQTLQDHYAKHSKELNLITWYPSCATTSFSNNIPNSRVKLFYCGFQWDNKRNSAEYRKNVCTVRSTRLFYSLWYSGTLDLCIEVTL